MLPDERTLPHSSMASSGAQLCAISNNASAVLKYVLRPMPPTLLPLVEPAGSRRSCLWFRQNLVTAWVETGMAALER
jgi:hypothetical protein